MPGHANASKSIFLQLSQSVCLPDKTPASHFFLMSIALLEIILTGTLLTQKGRKDLNLNPTVQSGEPQEKVKCEYIEIEHLMAPFGLIR